MGPWAALGQTEELYVSGDCQELIRAWPPDGGKDSRHVQVCLTLLMTTHRDTQQRVPVAINVAKAMPSVLEEVWGQDQTRGPSHRRGDEV